MIGDAPKPCIHDCVRPRRHLPDCDDRECLGCLPRPAEYGQLCWPCHRRFELILTDAPTVVAWLEVHLPRGTKRHARNDAEMRRGSAEAPAPIDLEVLDLDETWRVSLSGWVDTLRAGRELKGPKDREPATCSKFLLTWISTLEASDFIGAMFEELAWLTSDSHAMAPWRPEVRRIQGIPCPECHDCSLVIYGGETDVTCQSCRVVIPPERYTIWTKIAADEWGTSA